MTAKSESDSITDTNMKQHNYTLLIFSNINNTIPSISKSSWTYVNISLWIYYHSVGKGYQCKTNELFPAVDSKGGDGQAKFSKVLVKSLTNHLQRYLRRQESSNKHIKATSELRCQNLFNVKKLVLQQR